MSNIMGIEIDKSFFGTEHSPDFDSDYIRGYKDGQKYAFNTLIDTIMRYDEDFSPDVAWHKIKKTVVVIKNAI